MRALKLSLRVLLGLALASSGIAHLSFTRVDYVSQVPTWVPLDASLVEAALYANGVTNVHTANPNGVESDEIAPSHSSERGI